MTEHPLHLDLERAARCGFPEVVLGAGKTIDELCAAADAIVADCGRLLVTRVETDALAALQQRLPQGSVHERCRCFSVGEPAADCGPVAVVSAGTSDEPAAAEAALTLRMRGVAVQRFSDCGVAGLHRLLGHLPAIRTCVCAVAVAGMDAALASVLCGQLAIPVIGVPTSTGYGVCAGGETALHSMLASCAAGLTVVNIDNGFGAGYAAASIARAVAGRSPSD